MRARLMVLLITTVICGHDFTRTKKMVHNCSCMRNGNKYIQLAEHKCEKFTQYDNMTKLTQTHSCHAGLRFSVETCVCEHSHKVSCDGCGPLVCEVEGYANLPEVVQLKTAGECQRGDQISKDLLAVCIVKDPITATLVTLSYAAALINTPCFSFLPGEGCKRTTYCHSLMLAPEEKSNFNREDFAPEFLCENYKVASRCPGCAEDNGCKQAKLFRTNLRIAAAELCPHIQEFTCPADV